MELRATAEPEITGTTATVHCIRTVDAIDRDGSHPTQGVVVVKLSKTNGRWVIDAMQ
jgi:hypothetical protein